MHTTRSQLCRLVAEGHLIQRMISCIAMVVLATAFSAAAEAQQPTCIVQAIEKKLAGPARSQFMDKCATDMQSTCEKLAYQRRLDGAERTLFIKNCVNVYVGLQ
jgi:hypothetical protein